MISALFSIISAFSLLRISNGSSCRAIYAWPSQHYLNAIADVHHGHHHGGYDDLVRFHS